MARSVSFNGITKVGTGTILKVNAENLLQLPAEPRVLGLIGESEGGAPGSETGLVSLRSPDNATALFGSGDLADAIRLAFASSADALIPGAPSEVVVYKTNASTQAEVSAYEFMANATALSNNTTAASPASTSTVVQLTAALTGSLATANALVGHWARITVASLSATFTRRIAASTSGTITVTPALPAAPASTDPVVIFANAIDFSSRGYGLNSNSLKIDLAQDLDGSYEVTAYLNGQTQVSPALGNRRRFHVLYIGGSVTTSDTLAAGSSISVLNLTTGGLTPSAQAGRTLRITDGGDVTYARISTNGASTLTLETPLLSVPSTGATLEILSVTAATARFSSAVAGRASNFATTITGVTGDDLSINITPSTTLRQLIGSIQANSNYVVTVFPGINQDTTLAKDFDFTLAVAEATNIQSSVELTSQGFRQDIMDIVSWANTGSAFLTASRSDSFVGDGGRLNLASTASDFIGLQFAGAVRGSSSNSAFQAGLDAMLTRVVNQVVPLIDGPMLGDDGVTVVATWPVVSQMMLDHVITARTTAEKWRGGLIGFDGTKSQIISSALTLNDTDIQLTPQNVTILDASGNLTSKPPRFQAVMGASMRLAAGEIGEPLTHKFMRTSGVSQDSSWDPNDITDAADMINAGVFFANNVAGRGTRWNRDLTTYVQDDNLAFTDGSVRDIVRVVAQGSIDLIDNRFIGRKATPATVASVRDALSSLYESYRLQNMIVDSVDPVTGRTVYAYHNLKVVSSGDVISVNVGIFPAPGVNFAIVTLNLDLARQVA